MAPTIFEPSPSGPAWRDPTSAKGSTRDPTTSPGNPGAAPVRGATTPTGPATATPPGAAPVSYLMAQATIVTPASIRAPVNPDVAPPRPPRGSPRTNGFTPQTDTSDTLSDLRDEEQDLDSDSSSPDDDESALSSDGEPQVVSAESLRHWMRHHKGIGNSLPWRSTPPLGSFHIDHPRSNQRPPARPPGPPDSSDESSESTDDQRHELWAKVTNKRLALQRIKASLADKRREVRTLRARKDRIDNSFMQLIRPHLTSSRTVVTSGRPVTIIPTDEIEKRFGEMQRIRNDYYSAESTLELLEADVDREESALHSLETEFYYFLDPGGTGGSSNVASDHVEGETDSDDEDDDNASRHTLRGISGVLADDIHPRYQQLVDAAGDRELAKEHLLELHGRHNRILYELERALHLERARRNPGNITTPAELQELKESLNSIPTQPEAFVAKFGVSIDKDDLEFLQDYAREEQAARKAMDDATYEVDRLRELCMEQGVMRKNAPLHEDFAIHTGTSGPPFVPEGNITLDDNPSKTLAHPIFPILLSNPSHVLENMSPHEALERAMKLPADHPSTAQKKAECLKELGIETLMKKKVDSKPDYINQWLIHRLRTSPMEVELMFSISRAIIQIVNLRRWQEDVLYYWRKDAAAMRLPEDFGGPMTPRDDLDVDDDSSGPGVNSVAEASVRAKSERGTVWSHRRTDSRSVKSV
ncbi:hypothetical protein QBC47DRAFT_17861 [Echria macrotheca]|uniref:Uncharacterized protein n=1 Tax=Echria macrotheca TaxID=438768 RepID=A0AAJ0FA41_9PEZI|nr:hypothetical protein QBC47DRAFT_17861 [Echria macrotheca]